MQSLLQHSATASLLATMAFASSFASGPGAHAQSGAGAGAGQAAAAAEQAGTEQAGAQGSGTQAGSPAVQDGSVDPESPTEAPPEFGPPGTLSRLERVLLGIEPTPGEIQLSGIDRNFDQPTGPPPPNPERRLLKDGESIWRLNSGLEQLSRSGLSGSPGKVDTRRVLLELSWFGNPSSANGPAVNRASADGTEDPEVDNPWTGFQSGWSAGWTYEANQYRFLNASGILFNSLEPIEDQFRHRLWLRHVGDLDATWSTKFTLHATAGLEKESEIGESITVGGNLAIRWRRSEDFAWILGVTGTTQLEDDAEILPFVGVDWRINDRLLLETIGPAWELRYAKSDSVNFFGRVAYRNRQYRLDDFGPLPEGAFRDRELLFTGGLEWDPGLGSDWFRAGRVRLYGGLAPWHEIEFNANDASAGDTSVEAGLVMGISAWMAF